jgi:hypothetical protein
MYTGGSVLAACTGAVTCVTVAAMPATGMDQAIQVAVAAAAGLAAWAGLYIAQSLIGKR